MISAECTCRLTLADAREMIEIRALSICRDQAREPPRRCAEPMSPMSRATEARMSEASLTG
jgi:hypothetical protein